MRHHAIGTVSLQVEEHRENGKGLFNFEQKPRGDNVDVRNYLNISKGATPWDSL